MRCIPCGFENPGGTRFCGGCGEPLSILCPSCRFQNPPGFRFCGECGSPLPQTVVPNARPAPSPRDFTSAQLADKILSAHSAIEGERKQVTVLFADVKGSMDLSHALGAEDWHEVLRHFFEVLNEGVHRFEGSVNQYTGDGIMALFGAPIAHEDHAQRACYAALHLRSALRVFSHDVKRRHGVEFAVRMGLNSGDVVVGRIGDDLRMDYTALGHTVGLAQRMEALASGGSIYLAEDTARLAAGYFDLEDLGTFDVKGVDSAVRVHELFGAGEHQTRFDVSRARGLVRFVGRESEMHILERALEQTRNGNGQVVGLVAEAGTGKSRLSFEFTELCRSRGIAVNQGRCVSHGRNLPFLPVLELIRSYYGITPQDDDRTAREKVAGRMLLIDDSFRDVLPVLFEFLGIADPALPAPPLPPEARQRQLFGVLRSLTQSGGGPGQEASVVLFEDLHWIDGGSEAWLSEWVDATAGSRTLLLVNFRPEYQASWMQRSHYQKIALAPLSPDAIRELLAELIGTEPGTEGLAGRVHAHTAGNPFFAEEVVQSLIESGQLEGSRGRYRLKGNVDELIVPPSVQAVLRARMDRLGDREKRGLQAASVIGKNFTEPVLRAVTGLGEAELGAALTSLRGAEFLHEVAMYPVAEYTFKHPLTQAVALDSLLNAQRRSLHAAVARVLESLSRNLDEDAALLATHWDSAGDALSAARWHLRAADWIGARDVQETGRHAWGVIRALRSREDEEEAARLLGPAAARLMNLGWRLGMGEAEAAALYEDGKRWARSVGDARVEARLAGGYAAVLALTGDLRGCVQRGFEFAELAKQSGERELQLVELGWISYPRLMMGRLDEVLARLAPAMTECERDPAIGVEFIGASLQGFLLQWLLFVQLRREPFAVAEATLEKALHWARSRGEKETEALFYGEVSALLAMYTGDTARSLAMARRGVVLAEELANPLARLTALRGLAVALQVSGQSAEAANLALECLEESKSKRIGMQFAPLVLSVLAEARTTLGEADSALVHSSEAVDEAERIGAGLLLPDALYSLAGAHLANGNLDEAESALDRMEKAAKAIGAVNFVPIVNRRRASVLKRRGDTQGWERLLRAALEGFVERGATGHATSARVELEREP